MCSTCISETLLLMSPNYMVGFPFAASAVKQRLLACLPFSAKDERKRGHGTMRHVLSLRPSDAAIMADCTVGFPLAALAVKQLLLACFHLSCAPSCSSLCTSSSSTKQIDVRSSASSLAGGAG